MRIAQNLNDFHLLPPNPTETCPGVCVAERLSGFCEAILNVDDLCKSNLRQVIPWTFFIPKIFLKIFPQMFLVFGTFFG